MVLLADSISLGQPRGHFVIHFVHAFESKSMEMIPGRKSFDAAETRMLETACQDDVAIDPIPSNDKRGEAHSHLEGDTSFLQQDRDGAVQFCEVAQLVEDRADGRWLSFEMGSERITAARMRLIAICKLPFAVRASPHPVCRANHIKLCIVVATALWAVSPERPTGAWLHATAAIKTRVMPEPTAIFDIGREREKR